MNWDWNEIGITGGAYVFSDEVGTLGRGFRAACAGPRDACRLLESRGDLKTLPKNLGRFDRASLLTLASALWACWDAGLPLESGKRRIGIVGSSREGSLESNRAFFGDYAAAGRASARSNLFVYTLPTTPLAEAALFLGFTGPLWYRGSESGPTSRLWEDAGLAAGAQNVEAMFAVGSDGGDAVCLVLRKTRTQTLFTMPWLQEHIKTVTSVRDLIRVLNPAQAK